MYTIDPHFVKNLSHEYTFIGEYLDLKVLQSLLKESILVINDLFPCSDIIEITDITTLNNLFQKVFLIREDTVISYQRERMIRITEYFNQLLQLSIYNINSLEVVENPIIIGNTYYIMRDLIKLVLRKSYINGAINFLISSRLFLENECEIEKIVKIIANKNSLSEEKILSLEKIIEDYFKILKDKSGAEAKYLRVDMYLRIIDLVKDTSYYKNFINTAPEILFDKAIEIINLNIDCLITEKDLIQLLINEYNLSAEKYNIISVEIEGNILNTLFRSHVYDAFKDSIFYDKDEEYTLVSSAWEGISENLQYKVCMKKDIFFISNIQDESINIDILLKELAKIIYVLNLMCMEKAEKATKTNKINGSMLDFKIEKKSVGGCDKTYFVSETTGIVVEKGEHHALIRNKIARGINILKLLELQSSTSLPLSLEDIKSDKSASAIQADNIQRQR